jgi:hypothetical protein
MTQLNDLSNAYQVQSNQAIAQERAAIAANTAAQAALSDAQTTASTACDQTNNNYDLIACEAAQYAAITAQNQANDAASSRALNVAQSTLTGISNSNLSGGIGTTNLAATKALESDAAKAYNAGLQGIQQNGNDATQIQQLTNTYTATQGQLLAQEYQQDVAAGTMTADQAISAIQTMQKTYPTKIVGGTDPAANTQLISNFQTGTGAVLTQLKNAQAAKTPDSSYHFTGP